jgi:predicted  nucleic acid-binding Zn-ribbon protein
MTAETERDEVRGRLTTAETERDEVRGRLMTAETERDEVRGRLMTAETERDEVRGRLTTAETERDEMRRDALSIRKRLSSSDRQASREMAALKESLHHSQVEAESLAEQLSRIIACLTSTGLSLADVPGAVSSLVADNADLHSAVDTYAASLRRAEASLLRSKSVVSSLTAQLQQQHSQTPERWSVVLDSTGTFTAPPSRNASTQTTGVSVSRYTQTALRSDRASDVLAQRLADAQGEAEEWRSKYEAAQGEAEEWRSHPRRESWLPCSGVSVFHVSSVRGISEVALQDAEAAAAKWRSQAELAEEAASLADRVALAAEGAKRGAIESLETAIRNMAKGDHHSTSPLSTVPLGVFRELSTSLKELSTSIRDKRGRSDVELTATIDLHSAQHTKRAITDILKAIHIETPKTTIRSPETVAPPPFSPDDPVPVAASRTDIHTPHNASGRLRKSDLHSPKRASRISSLQRSGHDPGSVVSWASNASLKSRFMSRRKIDDRHSLALPCGK